MNEPVKITPISEVLADESHPAHAATKDVIAKLESGEINLCGCMGPMYGEPHCVCTMQRLGLPLNEAARELDRKRAETQLDKLFGPGGVYHKKQRGLAQDPSAQPAEGK